METAGEWLEAALNELCGKMESGLQLDADLISGLVSFCELAPPLDAADYLTNIIGADAGQEVIQQYLQKRGHLDPSITTTTQPSLNPSTSSSEPSSSKTSTKATQKAALPPATKDLNVKTSSKKKKGGKAISLAEASKGSVVFKQGQPCSCQARRHGLVSNCLSCGKIVCEQEGEGPCSFCGALVLKEGSSYAGLTTDLMAPLSEQEEKAEEFAKRLVDYDRNSAARTKVIDDQSDYYEIEGNSWLSNQEKEVLLKKKEEAEEAKAKKSNVIITFDLVGRKVVLNKDEASEQESDTSILRPSEEADLNRIKPNPTVKIQPVFVQTGPAKNSAKGKENKSKGKNTRTSSGLCLGITGRVQSDDFFIGREETEGLKKDFGGGREGDDFDCSHDFD
ncbi:hypothetical protein LUZ60_003102 [Juncus effusus]|nr:hypothetical protein LUZ60_003102 [Juncus effusus]